MSNNNSLSIWVIFIISVCVFFPQSTAALHGGGKVGDGGSVPVPVPGKHGLVVRQDQQWVAVSTEFGEIAVVKVSDGKDGFYDLQFITMEPNSLFVPVLLHSDMVFYVKSGSGTLTWVDLGKDKKKLRQVDLRTGDVYRLPTGSFFYLQSNLESDRRKFRIHAIFSDSKEEIREGSSFGAYSSVGDLLLGFDDKVLQAALNVNEVVLRELRSGGRQQMIVHGVETANEMFEMHYRSMRAFLGFMGNGLIEVNKNKKGKVFNILDAKHDFENCNGWSLVVTRKQMDALKDSDFGIFLVNLTKGSMMGPHWNPLTAEIAVVLEGSGMVHVVCPSSVDEAECKNSRFRVEEGDVFVVPRYHPMAQISFNNGSFIFMGFTTTQKNNHPQYLVGSASVFQVLDKRVLAASLGVSNTTMVEILSAQNDAIILECTSCAEEEERLMEEEIQREKEEEEREKEAEEEARRQEEARREQEEAQKRAEEEAKREQEEAQKREEEREAKRRQEEEAWRQEEARREQEEAQKRAEEEEARKREEEIARREQEEREAKRRQEEEEAARQKEAEEREQEEARKREEEAARREEEAKRRQEEEEAARQQEEAAERWRQQEEVAATGRRYQEEEAAEEQEQKAERRWQEEEELARQRREQEEASHRQQDEEAAALRQQEEEAAARRQQEQEAAARRQQEQEAAARRQQEQEAATMRRQQEEKAARQQEEAGRQQQQQQKEREDEAARQQEGARRQQQQAEAARQQEGARRQQQQTEAARQQEARRQQQEVEVARQQEEAMRRQQEKEASRQKEAAMRWKQEEEAARQQEAAMRQKHIEEAARQQEEARGYEEEPVTRWGGGSEHQHQAQGEGEAAIKKEQEMAQRARKAEQEAARREPGGGFKTEVQNPQRL